MAGREQRLLQLGGQRPQDARPQQHAGEQLAHYRRLANALHHLAQQAPTNKQRDDLGEEDDLGGRMLRSLRRERHRQRDKKQRHKQAGAPSASDHLAIYPSGAVSVLAGVI